MSRPECRYGLCYGAGLGNCLNQLGRSNGQGTSQLDDVDEAHVPLVAPDAAGTLFRVDCVEHVAIKSFQLVHAGFIEDGV